MLAAVNGLEQLGGTIRPLSRAEFEQLIAMGWFADERLELIDGLLVSMSPQSPAHMEALTLLHELLMRRLGDRARVRVQGPLAVTDDSEPESDLAVVAPVSYRDGHPRTASLVIEVSESSSPRDRHKAALYAAAEVPEYWIIDLRAGAVTVHTRPDPTGRMYRDIATREPGDRVRLVSFPDIELAVADLLG